MGQIGTTTNKQRLCVAPDMQEGKSMQTLAHYAGSPINRCVQGGASVAQQRTLTEVRRLVVFGEAPSPTQSSRPHSTTHEPLNKLVCSWQCYRT